MSRLAGVPRSTALALRCGRHRAAAPTTRHAGSSSLLLGRRQLGAHVEPDIEESDDPGVYEVILPPDPPVWGVSHIVPRIVPKHIKRPPYMLVGRASALLGPTHGDPYQGDGRIDLGSDAERCLRSAGKLAGRVLKKAEELVKVRGLSSPSLNDS